MKTLSQDLIELQQKVRHFIEHVVQPYEQDSRQDSHGPSAELRAELVEKARQYGLLTPHASVEMGGQGWTHVQ